MSNLTHFRLISDLPMSNLSHFGLAHPLQHACSCREEGCTPLGARLQVVLEGGLVDNLDAFGVSAEGLSACHAGDIKNPTAKLIYTTGAQDSRSQKLLFCARHL